MKRLLFVMLIVVFPSHCALAQELSTYYKFKAADRVKQVLKDFESAFGLLTNPYIVDPEERDEATYRMRASLRDDARFENDLIPDNKGTKTIDFNEYQRIAFISYKKNGLTYHVDWEEAEFKAVADGYLVLFYGSKSLFGSYQGQRRLQMEAVPCRAGVFLKMDGNRVTEAKIGFMDTDLKEKGKGAISLTEQRNPLEFITLPEVIDKLSEQIVRSIPKNGVQRLAIEEITFHGLGVSNDFSKQLTGTLKSALTRMNGNIQIGLSTTRSLETLIKLKGSYQKTGNFLKVGVQLFDGYDQPVGQELFAEILLLNIPNTEIEPAEHLVQEAQHIREITKKKIVAVDEPVSKPEKLLLELSTDKGYGPQSYREGDIMTLKVRANKPCTVRMIYQDAAKNILRLRNDDFTISTETVDKWIEIPEKFECAGPFGFELLLAYATERKFKPIEKTRKENGFTFILDDLQNIVNITSESDDKEKISQCTIPITTQAKRKLF
ncbi:DUF4384 domain-containing protein [Dyadobacter sp. CY261]|uniref:DUF4384 domain-containing protein n=1 Tax=Dyadobacter sp. CY261 TaxID=2907203 RepID=UPI001F253EBA|nr:DUF4384 domain-containing protein [Dyadobacter sp. CY261]MCF0069401.1 DUF4384 domain-containing protein [Dyadobacter sp. CY261]